MLVNHHPHFIAQNKRQDSITIEQQDEEEQHILPFKKAPNSFFVYKTIRRQEANGKYISSQQLTYEWEHMSKEQKAEFQNQSQCIQFTLDIDHRNRRHVLPKIIVPPPSSMVIPNDASPNKEYAIYSHHLHQPSHYHSHHHHHHSLSDLLTSPLQLPPPPPPPYHASKSTSPSNTNYTMSYSAAAEAAALNSLSYTPSSPAPPPPPPPPQSMSPPTPNIKKKYGILPEKVKRPPNAYLLFNKDMRRQLHDVHQGLSSGEISKSISARWKQLSTLDRAYYLKEEAKLKQHHNNQHANFIYTRRSKAEIKQQAQLKQKVSVVCLPTAAAPPPPSIKPPKVGRDPRGRKKKKPDESLPKHPMSGYLHYAKKMRPIMKVKYPEARLVEISKHIGAQWRAMTEQELQPWIDIANRDKARYAQEMKERLLHLQPAVEDDDQSFSSSSSSVSSLLYHERKSSLVMEELDSHTIASVAQMVNRSY